MQCSTGWINLGRIDLMRDGLTNSNGFACSPDGSTMHVVDSGLRRVYALAFDGQRGANSDVAP